MKTFLMLPLLLFSLLLACNSPKSDTSTHTRDTAAISTTDDSMLTDNNKDMPTEGQQSSANGAQQAVSDLIKVEIPLQNEEIQSPLTVKGQARGTWYFEGEFQILLKDTDDRVLARSPAVAKGPWMTEDFVPFEATLRFDPPAKERGTLVLQKANPSDNREDDLSYSIPVLFPPTHRR